MTPISSCHRWVVGLACTLLLLGAAAGAAAGAGATAVTLTPATEEVAPGATTTVAIVVENASDGVGAVNATVSVSSADVATITGVTLDDSAIAADVETNAANTSATVTGYGLNTSDAGQVVVGRVTLQGEAAGETAVRLQMNALGDESGIEYTVGTTTSTRLSVVSSADGGDGDPETSPTTMTTPTDPPTTTTTRPPTPPTTADPTTTIVTETSGSRAPGFGLFVTGLALLCATGGLLLRETNRV